MYLPNSLKQLLRKNLLGKLNAQIKFQEGDFQNKIPVSKYVETSIFILQELTFQSEPIPKEMKDAVIPIVWARDIPGKSKRAEPVRIKLKSDTGLVIQNQ